MKLKMTHTYFLNKDSYLFFCDNQLIQLAYNINQFVYNIQEIASKSLFSDFEGNF